MESPQITHIEARSGVSRAQLPDPFMIALYRALAPYRGCAHGCRYCDGRAEKYFVEGDFERDIAVRSNLPELVMRDLEAHVLAREFGAVGLGSGVTDVYQPAESTFGLTRETLAALVAAGNPVSILTKSALILRDFDLLKQLPGSLIMVTITTLDPAITAILEPGASLPAERLEIVRQARAAGLHAGIMAMPLCPGLSDEEDGIAALAAAANRAGAEFLWPGGLTLRPGRQKEAFFATLKAHWPERWSMYDRAFGENRKSGMPHAAFASAIEQRARHLISENGLPLMPPLSVYRHLLCTADTLYVLLCHMQTLYRLRGTDIRPLRAATTAYGDWLKQTRSALRRKRSGLDDCERFPVTRLLDTRVSDLCSGPEFANLCGNEKLARFARAIVIEKQDFDYRTLRLS